MKGNSFRLSNRTSTFVHSTQIQFWCTFQGPKKFNECILMEFNYCPLAWIFQDRKANTKLNKLFERALRISCRNSGSNSVNNYFNLNKSNVYDTVIESFITFDGHSKVRGILPQPLSVGLIIYSCIYYTLHEKGVFRRLFYRSFTKALYETATCPLPDWVLLLHEMINKCSQLVEVREGRSFSRTRLEIAAIIKQTVIFTSFFRSLFCLKVLCPKELSSKIFGLSVIINPIYRCL